MFNAFYCGQGLWFSRPWLEHTGSDQMGINKMSQKADIIPIFVEAISAPGANALKQEILSLGGEAAVHKHTIDCRQETTDVLLLGTFKHYKLLIPKLRPQFWRLPNLSKDLKTILGNIKNMGWQWVQQQNKSANADADTLEPSLDLVKDLRRLPLQNLCPDSVIVKLSLTKFWFSDQSLIKTYILALQSKGYQVEIQVENEQQKAYLEFLAKEIN